MWKVLALIPCLVLAADACSQLLSCENEITENSFFADEASLVGYANEAAVLDAVCSELGGLTGCITNNLDTCSETSVKNEIKAVKDIITYMCSPDGREVVLELANSPCNDNPMLELHMEIMMQSCLETFQLEVSMLQLNAMAEGRDWQISEVCPLLDNLEGCLVDGSADMCGAAMGTFMTNIWRIASADQFAPFGCHQQAVLKRAAVKRAVPMVLKRAALLRKFMK